MRKLLTTIYAIGDLLIGLASPVQALEHKLKLPSQNIEYNLKIPDDKPIKKITVYTFTLYAFDGVTNNKPDFRCNQIETLLTDGTKITDIDDNIAGTINEEYIEKTIGDVKTVEIDKNADGLIEEKRVEKTSIKTVEIDKNADGIIDEKTNILTKIIEYYLATDDDPYRTDIEKTFNKDGVKITEVDVYADGRLNSIITEKIVNGVKITDIDLGAFGRVYERRLEKIIDGKIITEIYPYALDLVQTKVVQEKILEIDL